MPRPKNIINDASNSVDEFIEGLLLQYPTKLVKLDNHHVLVAAQRNIDHVQLISGGGSGHEPSHAGWLGSGMLSAAVCGGIFASPSVSTILAAIRAVASNAGVLLIVKNYTGDRLNFGMAAERAAQEGINVQMVVIADDCALPRTKGITGARGVAGTVLVHKIAGAAAAAGQSLDQVATLAKLVASRMGSLGIALNAVTMPGAEKVNDRLDENTIEIGLGVHGEQGMRQSKLISANDMARIMITTIRDYGRSADDGSESIVSMFDSNDEVAILVNNLGGTSQFEMAILARSCVNILEHDFGVRASRVMAGSYMTSFNMHGASLSILNVSGHSEFTELLDSPTDALSWIQCDVWTGAAERPSMTPLPEKLVDSTEADLVKPPLDIRNFDAQAQALISRAVNKLAESEPLLTKYDTIVGDGDCGITMKRGATEIQNRLENNAIPTDHPVTLFNALAEAVSASMGGTSGILIELMFRKISTTLSRENSIGLLELSEAFKAGVDALGLYGGAEVGSRTMLDALVPAASTFVNTNSIAAAAKKAREGADSTAEMKSASAGRSNYLSEDSLLGTPDPGAIAVAIVLEAMASTQITES